MENKGKEGRRERERGVGGHSITTWTKFFPILTPALLDNCGHFTWYLPFSRDQVWTFYWTPPPLLVHVVIEWSLVELSSEKKQKTGSWIIVIAAAGACFSFISLFEAITFCLLPITVTENSTFCPKTLSVLRPLLCEICTAWTVNNVYVDPHPFCFEYIHTLLIQ